MILEGQVGSLPAEPISDGINQLILGKTNELIVGLIAGEYYQEALAGRLFAGNQAAAGTVLPIYSNTTQQCGLFNPLGSGKNIIPVKLNMVLVDTTGAAGGFCLGYVKNCGGGIATGSPGITVATLVTPINLNLGSNNASKATFMSAGITVAAPSTLMELDINQLVLTPATTGAIQYKVGYKFDGYPILEPGTAIFVAGNIATLVKMVCTLIWKEVPI